MTTSAPNVPIPAAAQARLDDLRLEVVRLGSSVTFAISSASQALSDGDLDEANRVVADDDAVDAQRHAIEDECMRMLGSSGLDAPDLRFVAVHAPRRTRARAHGRPDGQCRPHGLAPLPRRARRAGSKPHPPDRPSERAADQGRGERVRGRRSAVGRGASRHGRRARRDARPARAPCVDAARRPRGRCGRPAGRAARPRGAPLRARRRPRSDDRGVRALRRHRSACDRRTTRDASERRSGKCDPSHRPHRCDPIRPRAQWPEMRPETMRPEMRRVWGSGRGEFPAPHTPPLPSGPRTEPDGGPRLPDPSRCRPGGGSRAASGSGRCDPMLRTRCFDGVASTWRAGERVRKSWCRSRDPRV